MKLEKGMYVRNTDGYIGKYLGIETSYNFDGEYDSYYIFDSEMSPYADNYITTECNEDFLLKPVIA